MSRSGRRRPTGVKILVVLGFVQAALLLLAGGAFLVAADDPDLRSELEVSGSAIGAADLRVAGIVIVVIGVAQAALLTSLAPPAPWHVVAPMIVYMAGVGLTLPQSIAVPGSAPRATKCLRAPQCWRLVRWQPGMR